MDFNRQILKVELLLLLSQCFVTILSLPIEGFNLERIDTTRKIASALNPFPRRRVWPLVPRQPEDIPRVGYQYQMPLTEPFLIRGNEQIGNSFNILTQPRNEEQPNNDKDDTQNAIFFEQPIGEGPSTEIPVKNIEDNEVSKDILMEIFSTLPTNTDNSRVRHYTTDFDYSGTTDDYTTTTDEDLFNRSGLSAAAVSTLLGR